MPIFIKQKLKPRNFEFLLEAFAQFMPLAHFKGFILQANIKKTFLSEHNAAGDMLLHAADFLDNILKFVNFDVIDGNSLIFAVHVEQKRKGRVGLRSRIQRDFRITREVTVQMLGVRLALGPRRPLTRNMILRLGSGSKVLADLLCRALWLKIRPS